MTVGKHITRAAIAALVLLAAVLQMTRNVIVATFGAVVFGALFFALDSIRPRK